MDSKKASEDGIKFFNEVTFDKDRKYASTFKVAFSMVEATATIGKIKFSKSRDIFGIELVKDHLYGSQNFKTVEILLFKASLKQNET